MKPNVMNRVYGSVLTSPADLLLAGVMPGTRWRVPAPLDPDGLAVALRGLQGMTGHSARARLQELRARAVVLGTRESIDPCLDPVARCQAIDRMLAWRRALAPIEELLVSCGGEGDLS